MKQFVYTISLIMIAILFRTIWHVGPNIEFVTTATILAAVYLGPRWSIVVPIASIFVSDMIIGNTSIYLFTWSAYIVIGLVALLLRVGRVKACSRIRRWSVLLASGIGSGVWFYLWTNFGVWYMDSWNMYPDTIDGLIQSYVMGLPFLRYTILGNVLFTICSAVCIEVYKILLMRTKSMQFIPKVATS
jgi:hypothetical protein